LEAICGYLLDGSGENHHIKKKEKLKGIACITSCSQLAIYVGKRKISVSRLQTK